jgi:hypothetical protein
MASGLEKQKRMFISKFRSDACRIRLVWFNDARMPIEKDILNFA